MIILFILLLLPAIYGNAQDADEDILSVIDDPFAEDDEIFSVIDDPFAVEEDDQDLSAVIDDPFAADDEEALPDSDLDDLDSMFDTDSMIEVVDEDAASEDTGSFEEFLKSEGVEFGGSFSGSLSNSFSYDYLWDPAFDITNPEMTLTPSVSADLFFDARPDTHYRVFGKLGFTSASGDSNTVASIIPDDGLTFEQVTDEDGNTTFQIVDSADVDESDPNQTTITQEDVASDTSTELNISVKELFADFDWDNRVYFRFGKSTIKWGVGYFWSPTDVLNLTSIDVEDPTAELEGPVSLKIHYPIDINNLYLYLITENVEEPLDTAIAPKYEFVVGNTEIGIGGYYQRDLAPRAVATVSTTIGDFAVFGEGLASWGSDKVFVRKSKDQSAAEEDEEDDLDIVLDTYTADSGFFLSGTIGTSYMHEFEGDNGTFMITGQYYYNGEGYSYEDGLLEAAYHLALNSGDNGLALDAEEQPEGYEDPPALGTADLTNFGKHYLGMAVSFSSISGSDLSFSTLGIANLSDFSGMIIPTVTYSFMDYLSASAGMRITFGEEGDEYTNPAALISGSSDDWKGPTMSFTLEFSIGGGSF